MISRARIVFDVLMLLLFGYVAYDSLDFQPTARHFPLYISLAAVVLGAVNLVVNVAKLRSQGSVVAGDELDTATLREDTSDGSDADAPTLPPSETLKRALRYWTWLVAFVVLIAVLGIVGAVLVFLPAFLAVEARMRWPGIVVSVAITLGLLTAFGNLMNLRWPESLLELEAYLPLL